jgi:hypothetical protein
MPGVTRLPMYCRSRSLPGSMPNVTFRSLFAASLIVPGAVGR